MADLYASIVDLVPADRPSRIFNDYGVALLRLGQPERAVLVFERIAEAMRNDAARDDASVYFYNYGSAEELAGRPEKALDLYEESISCNARFTPALDAALRTVHEELSPVESSRRSRTLIDLLFERGALETAERHVRLALQRSKPHVGHYQEGAMLLLMRYLTAAEIGVANYAESWAPLLSSLDWKWGKQAAAFRD